MNSVNSRGVVEVGSKDKLGLLDPNIRVGLMVGPNLRVGPDPWTQRASYGPG